MTKNKTSQAVNDELKSGLLAPRYKAICEKYMKMEEALEKIAGKEVCKSTEEDCGCSSSIANEALNFDPLSKT